MPAFLELIFMHQKSTGIKVSMACLVWVHSADFTVALNLPMVHTVTNPTSSYDETSLFFKLDRLARYDIQYDVSGCGDVQQSTPHLTTVAMVNPTVSSPKLTFPLPWTLSTLKLSHQV
jgi:hypothetical protein